MPQSIDTTQFQAFSQKVEKLLKKCPEKRKELHERLAQMAQEEVNRQIDIRLNGNTGKIKGWQESKVGSKGGYAAVRPIKGKMPPNGKGNAYAYGHVTNAIENGHRVRMSDAVLGRRRPGKSQMLAVDGRFFYDAASKAMERRTLEEAEKLAQEITEELG